MLRRLTAGSLTDLSAHHHTSDPASRQACCLGSELNSLSDLDLY